MYFGVDRNTARPRASNSWPMTMNLVIPYSGESTRAKVVSNWTNAAAPMRTKAQIPGRDSACLIVLKWKGGVKWNGLKLANENATRAPRLHERCALQPQPAQAQRVGDDANRTQAHGDAGKHDALSRRAMLAHEFLFAGRRDARMHAVQPQ